MLGFRDFLTEANLGGKHKRSGMQTFDYYVSDNDLNSKEFDIESKTDFIYDLLLKDKKDFLEISDKVNILSKELIKKGNSTYVKVHNERLGIGFISITSIRKPTGNKFNRGDVSEGIIAATVAAKFTNPTKQIDLADVYATIDKLTTYNKIDLSNGVGDLIRLEVNLKKNSFDAFTDKSLRKELTAEYTAAIQYANSKAVATYAKLIHDNKKIDTVIVSSDGVSDEKGTKVDMSVWVGYGMKDGTQKDLRKLTHLSLSLKSGDTVTMAQKGATPEKVVEFWNFFDLPVDVHHYEKSIPWFTNMFREIAGKIEARLGNDINEKNFIMSLAKGIKLNATNNDDSVIVLHINKGDFNRYSFKNLEDKLHTINLGVVLKTDNKLPRMEIVDKNSGERLLGFRLEVRDGGETYKLHVEKGPLLNKLTKMK
jgi:hypothetical protein